ncbi:glycoside hydrolase [Zhengella mangrovi]|uniref:Glycoside hydrolase n=1 Tax=Zhengella mangrovi TaxID=1982044 RepID=A0A2G1QGS8_9HYPH|nr:glycoside hydrolase [Zhengella mangrovi]PHP64664.1 glycoside hydrolase [Zhengella mangrovi]
MLAPTTALPVPAIAALACLVLLALLRTVLPASFLAAGHNDRSNHVGSPRQIGGLALVPAAMAALAFGGADPRLALPFVILWLAGLADDYRPLGVALRLGLQLAASGLLIFLAGPDLTLPFAVPPLLIDLAMVLFLVWTINMVNFMDGLDLMTVAGAGIPLAATGAALVLAHAGGPAGLAALAAAGALAGFAVHNRHPARVFLGDSGSLPLGLVAGWALLDLAARVPAAALAPFGYYFADTVWTLLQRLVERKNILKSHSEHAYQRAFRGGLPVMAIIARVATATLAGMAATLLAVKAGPPASWVPGIAGLAIGFVLCLSMRRGARAGATQTKASKGE